MNTSLHCADDNLAAPADLRGEMSQEGRDKMREEGCGTGMGIGKWIKDRGWQKGQEERERRESTLLGPLLTKQVDPPLCGCKTCIIKVKTPAK